MRLFISICLPKEVRSYFAELQKKIINFDGKLVNKEQMHLTLKFLGDVPGNKLDLIKEKLKNIEFEKINCFTTDLGFFPSESHTKVIWVGLEPQSKIYSLQKMIDNSLKGLFSKNKNFHPHITLARVKLILDKEKFNKEIKKIIPEKMDFTSNSFKLIKSTLTSKGPVYEEIENFKAKL